MTSFFNNLLDRAIRVYFLHLMKLSDCVSRYVKRYHMINSLASHDP